VIGVFSFFFLPLTKLLLPWSYPLTLYQKTPRGQKGETQIAVMAQVTINLEQQARLQVSVNIIVCCDTEQAQNEIQTELERREWAESDGKHRLETTCIPVHAADNVMAEYITVLLGESLQS
jgi:hypothetical protein